MSAFLSRSERRETAGRCAATGQRARHDEHVRALDASARILRQCVEILAVWTRMNDPKSVFRMQILEERSRRRSGDVRPVRIFKAARSVAELFS
jgi:hypothetical protein